MNNLSSQIAHHLSPLVNNLIESPDLMGVDESEYAQMNPQQRRLFLEGEALYFINRQIGIDSSNSLFTSQWGFGSPEWFDHRHSWLNPDKWNHDFADSSVYNVLPKLPLGGKLLSLCCGDGFFEKHYYSKRCSSIVAVDKDHTAISYANRLHSADNIDFINDDLFNISFPAKHFDVVVMRSAIEHFTEEQQRLLFSLVKNTLKEGGWFVGDTPANVDSSQTDKLLEHHEHEWSGEEHMRTDLSRGFSEVHTSSLSSFEPTASAIRITLFWSCR